MDMHIYVFDVSTYTKEFLNLLLVPLGYTHVRNVSNRKLCIPYNTPVQDVWLLCPYEAQMTM
jgi:hypothetical protein